MLAAAKAFIRKSLPCADLVLQRWRAQREHKALQDVGTWLQEAPDGPVWLDAADLERMCAEHPFPKPYGYDPQVIAQRGVERAEMLLSKAAGGRYDAFLELACYDGMTSCALQQRGKQCHAVDLTDEGFDRRAEQAGVRCARMDAAALEFPDGLFDVVHSFNAFEHFGDPAAVLREALRVLRPGGLFITRFGPLYGSAKGLHAYDRIPVPYCQFLFPLSMMNAYLRPRDLPELDTTHCNGWTVRQFRALWDGVSDLATIQERSEYLHLADLEVVRRYPACFKGKVQDPQDLVVNVVQVVLRKHAR